MGCGCGNRRNKTAVTSVNQAALEVQQQESQMNALEVKMASLRAAIHNASSEAPTGSVVQGE
jgi:outer membrane murein-binding lipoprotein Lpp